MANIINRQQTFATNGTVDAASLHNLIDSALINSAIIKNQDEITTIGTSDLLLIAPSSVDAALAPRKVTVQNLIEDSFTLGTYVNLSLTGSLTYGTATGNRTISTSATITNLSNTSGTIATLNSTTGTIVTLNSTTGTIATLNSTTGTITNINSTTGTIATLNSTTGTISTINSTTGTIATLNSTTGTIGNLSTTLAGDFTISQGTGTLGTSGVTSGTYGNASAIPFITVDAKGRITSATTGTFSSTPPDASITPAKMSGAQSGSAPAYAIRGWVNFNGTGTISIRGSGNVSSISDGGVGIYTVNWNTPMPSSTYSVSYSINDTSSGPYCIPYVVGTNSGTFSTSAIGIENHTSTDPNARGDSAYSFVIAIV